MGSFRLCGWEPGRPGGPGAAGRKGGGGGGYHGGGGGSPGPETIYHSKVSMRTHTGNCREVICCRCVHLGINKNRRTAATALRTAATWAACAGAPGRLASSSEVLMCLPICLDSGHLSMLCCGCWRRSGDNAFAGGLLGKATGLGSCFFMI